MNRKLKNQIDYRINSCTMLIHRFINYYVNNFFFKVIVLRSTIWNWSDLVAIDRNVRAWQRKASPRLYPVE